VTRYLRTFADYTVTGTGFAFLRHAWRFWIYYMYPFTMLVLGLAVSLLFAVLIAKSGVVLAWLTAPIIFIAAMASFFQLVAKQYFVLHLMDLWSFSSDIIHRRRPDMDVIFEDLADNVAQNADRYDEIIMVGHSTGGALILEAAARALDRKPELADVKDRFWLMTVGSTSLKIGLHPAAKWYRDHLQAAFQRKHLRWIEFQCHTDIINFVHTNPAELMGLTKTQPPYFEAFNIRVRKMVSAATYKRIKRNFFRVHYQFVFGNTRPYFYDFPGICFGPASLAQRVQYRAEIVNHLHPGLPD